MSPDCQFRPFPSWEIQASGFKTLKENQRVEFEIKQGPKGKQATAIKPL